ncbi:MAG: cbb3-type cytochrome c oxidase subunit I [Bacteroidales bacterium]|jgi:cytochrome c oxidase subunit 1|nr:cbb3-type cytochrome c oxidase subunit I [Bacteroidales bacterium]MDD2632299.1 cbb3-type cytochrome c oxidase subunit I [Bacteroidales bacterium]MDD3132335.1 cbb3-type cytochrome c oxidase subunit I [Bacteroidales bacterium]MDD4177649.1 cbb3-type cytochrome c oxidase subunit I [Bacteroidales bacterium]MDD4742241.1 cbb3-type cytochrome c oxidase subunit I [Bacteroidales bacterium]
MTAIPQSGTYINFFEVKRGFMSWLVTADHKRIALLYFYAIMGFFIVAFGLGLVMRLELIAPGATILDPQTYNEVFTLHGVIMIFLFIIPGIPAIFGNFALPMLIGAPDVAFPKLNLISWYLYVLGGLLALSTLLFGDGPADTGWTFYAPYSVKTGTNVTVAVLAAFVLGFSSILTGLNFIVTMHQMRAPGMTWFKMPLFPWALYATAWIQVLATPIIGITLLMIVAERTLGLGLFDPALGGDPVLYQHLFWIYSHPAVYIMALPAMGIVSETIPVFVKKSIFGYKVIVYSSLAIAFIGYFVWGHHMFTSGMSGPARVIFSVLTFLVAIPSAIKVFNWVATLYKGAIDIKVPLLYALAFIFQFAIGGLTGLVVGALATDIHVHDTYFVVGHFHYVMFGGTGFAFFGALHFYYPKIWGRMYNLKWANIAFVIFFIGFNLVYFPMLVLGMMGMPRRYYDYLPEFTLPNLISTIGSWVLAIGLVIMIVNLINGRKGPKASTNPWQSVTLDWTHTQSPPTLYNFDETPQVERGPYDYRNYEQYLKEHNKN